MIDFTRAFDSAWERTAIILFRPFDPLKWLAIGLSAFLAGFLAGGNGFNPPSNLRQIKDILNGDHNSFSVASNTTDPQLQELTSKMEHAFSAASVLFIVAVSAAVIMVTLAIILLVYWLGARGQFLLLDNIARNRGAIVLPWKHYAAQANRLFLFYVLIFVGTLVALLPFIGLGIYLGYPLYRHHRWPEGIEIGEWVLLGGAYILVCTVIGFVLFIFREFGIPLIFRNGISTRAAFQQSLELIKTHFGSVLCFVLLRLALGLAFIIVSMIVCCLTCCIGTLPYIGSVVMLPALVFIRCFTLDCLAQFGPQYDIWTVDVPPQTPPAPGPLPLR